jgi:hypothetical protein
MTRPFRPAPETEDLVFFDGTWITRSEADEIAGEYLASALIKFVRAAALLLAQIERSR